MVNSVESSDSSRKRKMEQEGKTWVPKLSSLGRIYFYNLKTEVSQWDTPNDFDNDEEMNKIKGSDEYKQRTEKYRSDLEKRHEVISSANGTAQFPPANSPFVGQHVDLSNREIYDDQFLRSGRAAERRVQEFVKDQNNRLEQSKRNHEKVGGKEQVSESENAPGSSGPRAEQNKRRRTLNEPKIEPGQRFEQVLQKLSELSLENEPRGPGASESGATEQSEQRKLDEQFLEEIDRPDFEADTVTELLRRLFGPEWSRECKRLCDLIQERFSAA